MNKLDRYRNAMLIAHQIRKLDPVHRWGRIWLVKPMMGSFQILGEHLWHTGVVQASYFNKQVDKDCVWWWSYTGTQEFEQFLLGENPDMQPERQL